MFKKSLCYGDIFLVSVYYFVDIIMIKKCTCNSRIIITLQFILCFEWCTVSTYFRMVGSHFLVISAANGRPSMNIKINDIILYLYSIIILYGPTFYINDRVWKYNINIFKSGKSAFSTHIIVSNQTAKKPISYTSAIMFKIKSIRRYFTLKFVLRIKWFIINHHHLLIWLYY